MQTQQRPYRRGTYFLMFVVLGLSIGTAFGIALDASGLSTAVGAGVGLALGAALGLALEVAYGGHSGRTRDGRAAKRAEGKGMGTDPVTRRSRQPHPSCCC